LGDFNDVLKREGIEGVRKSFKGHLQDDPPALKDVLMSDRQDIERDNAQVLEETGKNSERSSGCSANPRRKRTCP